MGLPHSDPSVLAGAGTTRRRRRMQRAFASAVGTVVVVTVTMAGAQWLAAGTGEGFAKARKAVPLRTASAEASPTLFPGGTGDLALTVANDNPYDINVTKVSPNGAATSGVAACDDPGNGVAFAEVSGTWLIPRNGTASFVLPGSVSMAESSPDACQDQRFAIPVALTGAQRTGPIAPRLTISPPSATFGDQAVGTTTPSQRFTVGNAGNTGTTDLTAALSDATHFSITANTCGQLAVGASCTIDVSAHPGARGTFTAQLQVSAAGHSQAASLHVKGVQAVVVPSGIGFGDVPAGQSKVLSTRVTNVGDGVSGPVSLNITTGSVTPAGTFTILGTTCGAPLAPGAFCIVDVRFTPPQPGSFGGALRAFANPGTAASGNPATVSGNGV